MDVFNLPPSSRDEYSRLVFQGELDGLLDLRANGNTGHCCRLESPSLDASDRSLIEENVTGALLHCQRFDDALCIDQHAQDNGTLLMKLSRFDRINRQRIITVLWADPTRTITSWAPTRSASYPRGSWHATAAPFAGDRSI